MPETNLKWRNIAIALTEVLRPQTIYTSTHETRDWMAVVWRTVRSRSDRGLWSLPQLGQRTSSAYKASRHVDGDLSSIAGFRRYRIRATCSPTARIRLYR